MKFTIEGAHALVTGAGKGIGAATARRLVEAGARVSLVDIDGEALAGTENVLRGVAESRAVSVTARQCDITDPDRVAETVRDITREQGPITILVNNAGIHVPGTFLDQPMVKRELEIDVNLSALIRLTHLILPSMYELDNGVVVNISSAGGTLGVARMAVYSATKWGVWGFTEALRHEAWNLGKRGVHFASVHPGFLRHGLFEGAKIPRLGGVIVPLIEDHDQIAGAVVEYAVRRRRNVVMRPRSVRIAPFLRGVLPDALFQRLVRALGIDGAMESWRGRGS